MNVGIDFGTTNTVVCVRERGSMKCIRFDSYSQMLFSALYVTKNKEILTGYHARDYGIVDRENYICSPKKYIGEKEMMPDCQRRKFTPAEAVAEILKRVKEEIINQLSPEPDEEIEAVISVPAYYLHQHRKEITDACRMAGIKEKKLIEEPKAAAIAFIEEEQADGKILVIDIGGGTFDISTIQKIRNIKDSEEDVLDEIYITCGSSDGKNHLGGDDFDESLAGFFLEQIKEQQHIDLSSQETAGIQNESTFLSFMDEIRREAENAKKKLSRKKEVIVCIPQIPEHPDIHMEIPLTREAFELRCKHLFEDIERAVREYIKKEKISIPDIEQVVLSGGTCYIPKISTIMKQIFGRPVNISQDLSTLVAKGACISACMEEGVTGIAPNSQDLLEHSIWVSANGAELEKMIGQGTPFGSGNKISWKRIFHTDEDNRDRMEIKVYTGMEDENGTADFMPYGCFTLENLEKKTNGSTEIEFLFVYSKDKKLTVSAADLSGSEVVFSAVADDVSQEEDTVFPEPADLVLLFDVSGSMQAEELYYGRKKMLFEIAKAACLRLTGEMIDFRVHTLSVYTFGDVTEMIAARSSDKKQLMEKIKGIACSNGVTELADAIETAVRDLQKSEKRRIVIIVTDGVPRSKKYEDRQKYYNECIKYADTAKKQGIRIIIIGVKIAQKDNEVMKQLASKSDLETEYYNVKNMSRLVSTFQAVMREIVLKEQS